MVLGACIRRVRKWRQLVAEQHCWHTEKCRLSAMRNIDYWVTNPNPNPNPNPDPDPDPDPNPNPNQVLPASALEIDEDPEEALALATRALAIARGERGAFPGPREESLMERAVGPYYWELGHGRTPPAVP